MNTFKNVKVVMLPTNEKANIGDYVLSTVNELVPQVLRYGKKLHEPFNCTETNYHLYILSDDNIKEDDWYFNPAGNQIIKCEYKHGTIACKQEPVCKKIIATTDKLVIDYNYKFVDNTPSKGFEGFNVYLPQPSQSFINKYIEEYNKGNIITDVLVEYWNGSFENEYDTSIKVNHKDNTITIKKIKTTWDRDQVINIALNLLANANVHKRNNKEFDPDKWLENTLNNSYYAN